MSKLDRWLPFKFFRKDKGEKHAKVAGTERHSAVVPVQHAHQHQPLAAHGGQLPAAWPFAPMQQMLQTFANDPFFRDPFGHFGDMERWFGDFSPNRFVPSVEVADEEGAIRVTAELPGMTRDEINLQLEDDLLVISGQKKNEEETKEHGVFRTERYYGYFQRAVPLPDDVDRDSVEADFKDGVLTVRMAKTEGPAARGKRIAIRG